MEKLNEEERLARTNKDEEKIKTIFLEMLNLCKTDTETISLLKSLSLRNGQIKPAFQWITKHVFESKKNEYEEIETEESFNVYASFLSSFLKNVIEGKMFLEQERMIVSSELKKLYEKKGDLKSAMNTIFDIPVETFSSIREEEIIWFQLEQLRISIINQDWIKADVCGKRIRRKYFSDSGDVEKEIIFDKLMIQFYLGVKNYLDAGKTALRLSEKVDATKNVIFSSFLTLISKFGNERDENLKKLIENKHNSESVRKTLSLFLKNEIIKFEELQVFIQHIDINEFKDEIIICVDTHNLIVISKSCTLLRLDIIASLLSCSVNEVVDKICYVVNNKILKCKIEESKQLVRFNMDLKPDWIKGVDNVLTKVMRASHLIKKERLDCKNRE